MKHKPFFITIIVIGNLLSLGLIILSLISFIQGSSFLQTMVPDPEYIPLVLLILGLTLLIFSNRPWGRIIQKDTMPKEKRIELEDERNVYIHNKAGNLAFQFLAFSIAYIQCILLLLGYIPIMSSFFLSLVVLFSFLVQQVAKRYYQYHE